MSVLDHPFLKPFLGKSALLDSNILLLYWAIPFDSGLIHTFKRLSSFQDSDFILLSETLKGFHSIRTTTHVLTEVSNLANSLPGNYKVAWSAYFADRIQKIAEDLIPSATLASSPLMRLGLTDAALAHLATTHVVLTLDFPLSQSLEARGMNVINFNHLRAAFLA